MHTDDVLTAVAADGIAGATTDMPLEPLGTHDWQQLLNAVGDQRIPGLLVRAVVEERFPITDAQRESLARAHERAMLVCLQLERRLLHLGEHLRAAGIDFRVLKGAAYAALVYPDRALRAFGDNDVLVRSEQFDEAMAALGAAGYARYWPELRPGFDRRFSKGVTLRDSDEFELDLHRTFALGPLGLTVDLDTVFAGVEPFELGGSELPALDADCRFLHACYHAALGDDPPRLMALRDVAEIMLNSDVDDARVLQVAQDWRGLCVVARAVKLTWETFGIADVTRLSAWASAYRPSGEEARLLATYLGSNRSHTAKSLASLRVIPGLRNKAAFVWASLFPSKDFVSTRDSGRMSWLRRGLRTATSRKP